MTRHQRLKTIRVLFRSISGPANVLMARCVIMNATAGDSRKIQRVFESHEECRFISRDGDPHVIFLGKVMEYTRFPDQIHFDVKGKTQEYEACSSPAPLPQPEYSEYSCVLNKGHKGAHHLKIIRGSDSMEIQWLGFREKDFWTRSA